MQDQIEFQPHHPSPLSEYILHFATSDNISSLAFGLSSPIDGNCSDMHLGRARLCCRIVLEKLCFLRDEGVITLTVDVIKKSVSVQGMIDLLKNENSDHGNTKLLDYLSEIPELNVDTPKIYG